MDKDENLAFVEMANPHAWLMTAWNLHEQALLLRDAKGAWATHYRHRDGTAATWDGANRGTFLLGGFALENALKAFLVFENPGWISHGKLGAPLRSHSLTGLQSKIRSVPYKRRLLWVLRGFEDGIDSWSRYPCALSADRSRIEGRMTETLWSGYLGLMCAYGNALRTMMSGAVWKGPHGFEGRWSFYADDGFEKDAAMGRRGYRPLSQAPSAFSTPRKR